MLDPRKWIDPRDIDWTDAINGTRPGLQRLQNPFANAAANDQFMQALRQAKGIEPRIFVCPDPANQLIQPGATYDYEVPSEPNTWLWAICASIQNLNDISAGNDTFLVSITDSSTGATLFSQPVNFNDITGIPIISFSPTPQGSGNGYRGPLMKLSTPHLFTPPSYPVVRIISTATEVALKCRVTLYTVVEYDI